MNLLVTGGAGYIGSICVEMLLKQGHKVVIVDNLQEGNRAAVPSETIFYEDDFSNKSLLKEIFRKYSIASVLHFAADTKVEESMTHPSKYFHNNLIDSITLLDTMLKYGCDRIIFSSTAAIFGEPQYVPIDEAHQQKPINPYGESKLLFEKVLDWYHKAYDLKYITLRYFNAAGASERLGDAHRHVTLIIPVILQVLMGQRSKFQVFGNDYPTDDGTCVRDFIHVVDLAKAHILAIRQLERNPCGKYNLGNGKGFSVLEVIKATEKVTGKKVPFEFSPRRLGDAPIVISSSKRAKEELGWVPQYNIEGIIESAWNWHQNHPNGYD